MSGSWNAGSKVVLEAADHAIGRDGAPYAEVLGYAATSDAHHMVQPRPDGAVAARAITLALRDATTAPDEIDYVNAHASSTQLGDLAEARAIASAFGDAAATLPVSGTKALYGHPLGASGAIETALCALAIRSGIAPGNANLADPDPAICALLPGVFPDARRGSYERVVTISLSFGGLNAALVLGAPDGGDRERGHAVRLQRQRHADQGPGASRQPSSV